MQTGLLHPQQREIAIQRINRTIEQANAALGDCKQRLRLIARRKNPTKADGVEADQVRAKMESINRVIEIEQGNLEALNSGVWGKRGEE